MVPDIYGGRRAVRQTPLSRVSRHSEMVCWRRQSELIPSEVSAIGAGLPAGEAALRWKYELKKDGNKNTSDMVAAVVRLQEHWPSYSADFVAK